MNRESSCPIIIGAGLAGLTAALSLAPMPVIVLSGGALRGGLSSSGWAQGGIAAAVGEGDDPALHAEDTIKAGAGLCDPDIVRLVTEGGAGVIEKLVARGVQFDRDAKGNLQLGLEGAHGRNRIVHAGGDGAGRAIMQAVTEAVLAAPSIEIIENAIATDLLTDDKGITGVVFMFEGKRNVLPTSRVVLATGGAGALWQHTTNPPNSLGQGLVLAARAGAQMADLEFMQFHPTAIDIGRDPMPLASEALRGEGAILIDEKGERFMQGHGRAELEPRDVVARAIHAHLNKGHRVFLDARAAIGAHFAARFPAIYAACAAAGVDPAKAPVPVRPAAHYHMGGIAVDAHSRSSVKGLWACGEVASTGLHGANRLASNSLLEAAFFGEKVAEDILSFRTPHSGDPESHLVLVKNKKWDSGFASSLHFGAPRDDINVKTRAIMSAHAGVLRDEEGLEKAVRELAPLAVQSDMALAGLMIAVAALQREESRGSHARTDYPALSAAWARRQILTLEGIQSYAQGLNSDVPLAAAGI